MPTTTQSIRIGTQELPGGSGESRHYAYPVLSVDTVAMRPLPPGYLRLRMDHAGIRGTDPNLVSTHPDTGILRSSAPDYIPLEGSVIGHVGIGQVLAVGEGVYWLETGGWVVPVSVLNSGKCASCQRSLPNQCHEASLLGLQMDGLFSKCADISVRLAPVVTSSAQTETNRCELACLELEATALQACDAVRLTSRDRVVVFGSGPIGLFTTIFAEKLYGCASVTAIETGALRREIEEKWCDCTLSLEQFHAKDTKFDVLIDASGELGNVCRVFTQLDSGGGWYCWGGLGKQWICGMSIT